MPRARGRGGAGRGRAAEGPLGPADARELFERAKRLTAAQSYSDARRILDRLARHAPDETAVRLLRARVFMVGHRDVARARDDLEHVLAGRPQHVGAAVSYARLLVMSGDLAGAEARARALFAQAPDAPEALNLLSEIAPAAVRAEDAERFEKRLAAGEIGAGAALAHHALGRIWDARGAVDRAFAHIKAGNDAAYAARPQPYRADLEQARFEHVRDGITAEMMAAKAGFGVKSGRPIFIVGMPRCGSTLLEHALAAHPKLDAAGECNVLHRVEQELWARGGRAPQAFDRVALLAGLGKGDAQLGGAAYLEQTRFFLRKNHVGPFVDKTLPNYTRLPLIFSIFRDARVIHLFRDPMDVCWSCYKTNFESLIFSENLPALAHWYKKYVGYMDRWSDLFGDKIIHVSHEAFAADPATQIRALAQRLGIEWRDDLLETASDRRRIVTTPSAAQVRAPISTRAFGGWRRYEAHLGPLIDALGGHARLQDDYARFSARAL